MREGNRIYTPSLYFCNIEKRIEQIVENITKRRAYRAGTEKLCLKTTHVQRFELIEEVLIQIHGVVFVSCMCMLNGMFMVLLFLSCNCFYAMYE